MASILLVGEQVTVHTFEIKGFDYFGSQAYREDGAHLVKTLEARGHRVSWMRTCQVPLEFPESLETLKRFDVIFLSDVGSNSLLFHPDMLARSMPRPNRLELIKEFVQTGGGLGMIGGWMSFAGIDGRARYRHSPVEEVLPVTCSDYDDRVEMPQGVVPVVCNQKHILMNGIPASWPFFLGYNRVAAKPHAMTLLKFGDDPLLCLGQFGKGRSAAFTSDCAPHWGPNEFLQWSGYSLLWDRLSRWLSGAI